MVNFNSFVSLGFNKMGLHPINLKLNFLTKLKINLAIVAELWQIHYFDWLEVSIYIMELYRVQFKTNCTSINSKRKI